MKVTILFFARTRELVGNERLEIELPEAATIADLRRELSSLFPAMEEVVRRSLFAIDEEYAADGARLREGALVACIPPVSGGAPATTLTR